MTLLCLYWTSFRLLSMAFGENAEKGHAKTATFAALLPVGYLAFALPFWSHSLVAEVYTLHAFLTCLIILLLLYWGERKDFRYLYSAALVYGVSAGNHATVAFYLPAILLLFFLWAPKMARDEAFSSFPISTGRHLAASIVFFLVGFSVYAYLPVRSFAEPSFDWGNPETLDGFLFQVTDRKDAQTHFSSLKENLSASQEQASLLESTANRLGALVVKVWHMIWALLTDVQIHLSPVSALGFLLGAVICFRKNRALFVFFLALVAGNVAFFANWRKESFFPSYLVVSLFTSLSIFYVLQVLRGSSTPNASPAPSSSRPASAIDWRRLVWAGLFLLIPWTVLINFYKVDRSGHYYAETLAKKIYLSLPDNALFIPGLSWFNYYYAKDVQRLRDDVTAVGGWDLLSENPPSWVTHRRFPTLDLPDPAKYRFDSRQRISDYSHELFERNGTKRRIILEQNETFYEQTTLTGQFRPFRNVLLQYVRDGQEAEQVATSPAWGEFLRLLEEDVGQAAGPDNMGWLTLPYFLIYSSQMYYHDTGRYADEREVLKLMNEFLGKREADWQLKMTDNLMLDGKPDEARQYLDALKKQFPATQENWLAQGLTARAEGRFAESAEFLRKAGTIRPDSFRPNLELAITYNNAGDMEKVGPELDSAVRKVKNLREWLRIDEAKSSLGLKGGN